MLAAQKIVLEWASNPESDIKFYSIYRASSTHDEFEIARIPANQLSFRDFDVVTGHVYYYRIAAVDAADNVSSFSRQIEIVADIRSEIAVDEKIPAQFELKQNYPNPFNPMTNLTYMVAEESHISLVLFDVMGRKVRTLVDKNHSPGTFNVAWDGHDEMNQPVATGIYFARFNGGGVAKTRKLILSK